MSNAGAESTPAHRFQAARPCRGKRSVGSDPRLKLKYTACGGPFEPRHPQVSLEKLGHATGRNVGTAIALGSRAGGS